MADFRRWITALAVLALFAGLASAQVGGSGSVGNSSENCTANVAVTPQLRAEGYTEQTGDIALICTGGVLLDLGKPIPQANITIYLNTAVTSRLLPTSTVGNASEALLLIDEPGSGLSGYGPTVPLTLCSTPLTGCAQWVGNSTIGGAGVPVATNPNDPTSGAFLPAAKAAGANVFQGIVSGNSVTWFGVPVQPPSTNGNARVYRFTNIRANATTLSGGSAAGATPVIASIAISGATSVLISNPTPTVGFVGAGLTTSTSSTNFNQCSSQTRAATSQLTFSENFGTAFKTRVVPLTNTARAGQGVNIPGQNIPGTIYNSESNFIWSGVTGTNGATAGLADFGTRLKATFNNIPSGVRLFVSVGNVNNLGGYVVPPANPGDQSTTSYAQLVAGETLTDGVGGGFVPIVSATDNGPGGSGNVPMVEITLTAGSGVATWEIMNTNPLSQETIKFGVYATYSANVAGNSPPPSTGTVNLSFAPTPPLFSASSGSAASSSLTIPRFIADPGSPRNMITINLCRTVLLYPYVTNQAGFDTGLAIANTSTDPFGTGPQSGACRLNWYQGAGNPPVTNTGTIASGTVYTTLASIPAAGFQGYMIAICDFQYAHGFAFVSDVGARNLAMGYLALVVNSTGAETSGRSVDSINPGMAH